MLFKSSKFFDSKSKKTVKLVFQKLILLKTCVIILWNIDNYRSICVNFSIFFCMLQVKAITFWDLTTWKCVISLYTYIYVKQGFVTHIFSLFLTKHLEFAQFLLFCNGTSPSWCWIFLFNQLTLLLLCLNVVKQWHQEKWMPLKM